MHCLWKGLAGAELCEAKIMLGLAKSAIVGQTVSPQSKNCQAWIILSTLLLTYLLLKVWTFCWHVLMCLDLFWLLQILIRNFHILASISLSVFPIAISGDNWNKAVSAQLKQKSDLDLLVVLKKIFSWLAWLLLTCPKEIFHHFICALHWLI